jgi:hypothetical protein
MAVLQKADGLSHKATLVAQPNLITNLEIAEAVLLWARLSFTGRLTVQLKLGDVSGKQPGPNYCWIELKDNYYWKRDDKVIYLLGEERQMEELCWEKMNKINLWLPPPLINC